MLLPDHAAPDRGRREPADADRRRDDGDRGADRVPGVLGAARDGERRARPRTTPARTTTRRSRPRRSRCWPSGSGRSPPSWSRRSTPAASRACRGTTCTSRTTWSSTCATWRPRAQEAPGGGAYDELSDLLHSVRPDAQRRLTRKATTKSRDEAPYIEATDLPAALPELRDDFRAGADDPYLIGIDGQPAGRD